MRNYDHSSYRHSNDGILPVCTQISITKAIMNCAIQMMVQRCFTVTHLSNYAAKSPYECLLTMHFRRAFSDRNFVTS